MPRFSQVELLLDRLAQTLPAIDCQRDLVDEEEDLEENLNECAEAVQAKKAKRDMILVKDKHGTIRFMPSRATIKDVQKLPDGDKILVVCNRYFIPDRNSAKLLRSYCKLLAESSSLAPLCFTTWNNPAFFNFKVHLFQIIESKFLYHVNVRRWVYDKLSKSWRLYKGQLKKIFDKSGSVSKALEDRPEDVSVDQWQKLVSEWASEKKKKQCETNKANSRKAKYPHTLGRKSAAVLRKEMMDMNDGKAPDVLDLYLGTHTKQDGSFVNEATREKMDQAKEARAKLIESCRDVVDASGIGEKVLNEVLGPEHSRRAKRLCLGPYSAGHAHKRVNSWTYNERGEYVSELKDEITTLKEKTEEQERENAALRRKFEELEERENAALRRKFEELDAMIGVILGKEISREGGSSISCDVPNGSGSSSALELFNNQMGFPNF